MKKLTLLSCLLLFFGGNILAQTKTEARSKPSQEALEAELMRSVRTFEQSLTESQRKKAIYAFADEERFNWYFVPRDRNGLPLKEMNTAQRQLVMAVLQAALSQDGYSKAKAIMELEVILKALENRSTNDNYRDPENYYFTLFGSPARDEPWGWRLEGHHLSLNFSSVSGKVVAETPTFMGSNPAIVPDGPAKGKQILKQEAVLAFALLHSLTAEQLQKTIIAANAPNDIITGNKRKVMLQQPEGILFTELTADQQKIFKQLLQVYLGRYRQDRSHDLQVKLEKAGTDKLYFAWAGSQQPGLGNAHYYRIQNPVLLIEYDNSQNNANHVHTVVRDLTNDFGEDALRLHYKNQAHKK